MTDLMEHLTYLGFFADFYLEKKFENFVTLKIQSVQNLLSKPYPKRYF